MKKKEPVKQKNKKSSVWLIAAAIVVFAGVVWFSMRSTETSSSQTSAQNTAIPVASAPSADSGLSSQYATLSPSMFTGKAREAYQAATAATQLEPLRRFYARRIAELD